MYSRVQGGSHFYTVQGLFSINKRENVSIYFKSLKTVILILNKKIWIFHVQEVHSFDKSAVTLLKERGKWPTRLKIITWIKSPPFLYPDTFIFWISQLTIKTNLNSSRRSPPYDHFCTYPFTWAFNAASGKRSAL